MKEYNFAGTNTADITRARPQTHSRHMPKRLRDAIFIIVMLAYPVTQFLVTWIFVNFGALANAFNGSTDGVSFTFTLDNFKYIFQDLSSTLADKSGFLGLNRHVLVLLNSLGYCFITIFISLPLSMLFSYFLRKKMPIANVFRAIFFLPNIIPIVALTYAFKMSVTKNVGYMSWLFEAFGLSWASDYPDAQIMVYLYCIWAGLGYNIILFSGAIGRIPKELFESAELDHAGYFKEFFHVVVPCIWPTVVTLIVLGMTHVLTLYLQPLLLIGDEGPNAYTIAFSIFEASKPGSTEFEIHKVTAYGLFFSLIWAPIILLVRHFVSKKYEGIGY